MSDKKYHTSRRELKYKAIIAFFFSRESPAVINMKTEPTTNRLRRSASRNAWAWWCSGGDSCQLEAGSTDETVLSDKNTG